MIQKFTLTFHKFSQIPNDFSLFHTFNLNSYYIFRCSISQTRSRSHFVIHIWTKYENESPWRKEWTVSTQRLLYNEWDEKRFERETRNEEKLCEKQERSSRQHLFMFLLSLFVTRSSYHCSDWCIAREKGKQLFRYFSWEFSFCLHSELTTLHSLFAEIKFNVWTNF